MTTETQTHTPGDWHVNGVDTIMSVKGNCTIAKVFHPERDAQLLAAAPKLLDALRDCLEAFHNLNAGGYSKAARCFNPGIDQGRPCSCSAHKARAAIKRATPFGA